MPCVAPLGYLFRGDNRTIDAAGWQCTAPDPDEGGRCRLIATYTHRRIAANGAKRTTVALCGKHFAAAGPEAWR